MCILKYLNRKLSIIKYEIPSENLRYKETKNGKGNYWTLIMKT